ncbi:MAG: DEAD/DEAH box helicase [Deltaproteobacteria bacterium]|nr:DEAD/DEAH box helicase [Deltaproteobacteria bacterium]
MQKIKLTKEPVLDAKHQAFKYQKEAVDSIRDLEYSAVFHEQGLGKSKIAIDLMLYWLENKVVDTVLFVAKKGLIKNWEKEFASHTHMTPKIITQNERANYYAFNSPSRLILAHFEVLKSERERFELFLKARNVAIIIDESAKIKNPDSTLTRTFFALAPLFKRRVVMTGTPAANRPYDIWAQIWFLDQGASLGNDFTTFKRSTNLSNELFDNEKLQNNFESALDQVFNKISKFTVRETKQSGIIELPQKIFKTVLCDWEVHQHDLYRQIKDEMKAVIVKEGIPQLDNSQAVLKRLLRLVQVASNPSLIDDNYRTEPGKLLNLVELVEQIAAMKEKCLIWSSFADNVNWLADHLSTFGTVKVHGKVNMERRNRAVEKFLTDPETRVFVATPQAAKEGLTLTVANHVIFYDRTFSLDDYIQAQDRIHRISQTKPCHIYNLIMAESIDEWIEILLHSKQLAAQLTQGDISREYYKSQISYEFGTIIRNILGIDNQSTD